MKLANNNENNDDNNYNNNDFEQTCLYCKQTELHVCSPFVIGQCREGNTTTTNNNNNNSNNNNYYNYNIKNNIKTRT
jgi:hypothetical protein